MRPEAGAGAPPAGIALVALELGLLLVLAERLDLESEPFRAVLAVSAAGFLLQHALAERLRPAFFAALSLAGFALVLGWGGGSFSPAASLARTGTLLGIGLGLLGICRLPLAWPGRIALLLAAAGGLACLRSGLVHFGPLDAIWPVVAASFMFRLLVYVYDLRHGTSGSRGQTLAYFFLLPSVCFPLFPVIDYKTFLRSRGRSPLLETYQEGVAWIFRGVIQILLWRVVYYHLYLDPSRVASGEDLALYALANVALYLRVSGQFHIAVGILHLFGWRLPETNRRYFLAASFNDYWRRVNIYWKDFIMKLFYYPAFFRWKRSGEIPALVLATLFAFAMTWLLHSYQWFWLRGDFPVRAQDAIFWGSLALLVTANSLFELRRGRPRSLGARRRSWRESLGVGLRTGLIFSAITVLWSLWTADSLAQWLEICALADAATLAYAAGAFAAVAACAVAFEAPPGPGRAAARAPERARPWLRGALARSLVPFAAVYALSSSHVYERLPRELAVVLRSLGDSAPNKSDEEFMVRGYYENLMDVGRFNALLSGELMARPADWRLLEDTEAVVVVHDQRTKALAPNARIRINGKIFATNSWGMRDAEYSPAKPEHTTRIALLGSSLVMGWGVNDGEAFESLVEERLDRELSAESGRRFEILNFAVNGYSPLAQVEVMRQEVARFRPDAVVLVGHPEDPFFTIHGFAKSLRIGVVPEDEFLREVAERAEVGAKTPERWAERRLEPHAPELIGWAFREIAAAARRAGAAPLYVHLPGVLQRGSGADDEALIGLARQAGFATVALFDAYGDGDRKELVVAPWDAHPNAAGHAAIAEAFYRALRSQATVDLAGREVERPRPER
jgi:hypothetical protein